jgi:tetratricopeptide (TPR) repeat protein
MKMNNIRQRLILLLMGAFLTTTCCGAKAIRLDGPRSQMTVSQARKALAESLQHLDFVKSAGLIARDVKITRTTATWMRVCGRPPWEKTTVNFLEVKNVSVSVSKPGGFTRILVNGNYTMLGASQAFETDTYAMQFIDAILTLKAAAQGDDDGSSFVAFSEKAKVWLATTPKAEMSDEARTYRLLAEDAFKRQDIAAALEAYGDALDLYPMWPEGHYNAALLAAEIKDYGLAADHMRRYLVLAPNAKDARAAKDKLLLWQHKAKE